MSDTAAVQVTQRSPRVAGSGRSSRLAALFGATLLMLAALPRLHAAEPAPLDARVVWVRGDRAYVAARDSLAIPPFSRLTFAQKSKTIATGEVERTVDGGIVVVRITSGSLEGVKHLDRMRIIAEAPDRPGLLRVGFPSPKRAHPRFACDSLAIVSNDGYSLEGAGPHYRLINSFGLEFIGNSALPDTVLVSVFDDATDQEIALERGDLDVAMFLPGELSSRMRDHPRWKERLVWSLENGLAGAAAQGQVVCRPEVLPYLRDMGPSTLAPLLQCVHLERRP